LKGGKYFNSLFSNLILILILNFVILKWMKLAQKVSKVKDFCMVELMLRREFIRGLEPGS
jgi:hypothetical protein